MRYSDGRDVLSLRSAVVYVRALYCIAGSTCVDRTAIALPATTAVVPGGRSGVLSWRLHFCFDYGAVVPAEVIEHFAYLVQRNEEYGGFWRVTLSLLLEVLSVLLAPVRMLFHTVFVVSAFIGWKWCGIHRSVMMTPLLGEAFKRHGSQLLLGLVWAVGMAWLDLLSCSGWHRLSSR